MNNKNQAYQLYMYKVHAKDTYHTVHAKDTYKGCTMYI